MGSAARPVCRLPDLALTFVSESGAASPDEALEGARHIIAEWVSENAEFRKSVRGMMMSEGIVVSRAIEGVAGYRGQVPDVRAV